MEKLTPVTALKEAVDIAGGQSALAEKLRVSPVRIWNWLNRDGGAPASFCPDIEAATKIPCEQLYPDANWAVLRRKPKKAA